MSMAKVAHSGNADMDAIERQARAREDAEGRAMARQEAEDRKTSHTSEPWVINDKRGGAFTNQIHVVKNIDGFFAHSICLMQGGTVIARDEQEANAVFICRAANNHEALLEALREAREHINGEIDVVDGSYGEPAPNKAMLLAQLIDAAIAKAEGK
jgi:hypothetical protein